MERVNFLGAIVGDIVGSIYEFNNYRKKDFPLFSPDCFATDDSIMTLAVAKALIESRRDGFKTLGENAVKYMQAIGRPYRNCGYGGRFREWIYSDDPKPYHSFGNGAAMRVSPAAYFAETLEQCKQLSHAVTEVTHNHPEGIKGAEATAVCVWCALHGRTKNELHELIRREYYPLNFTIDKIRPTYIFNETCQETVPQALEAFFESTDFEDAIRTAVSVGGDSDTLAAITGAVAGAYYGVPNDIAQNARAYLDSNLAGYLDEFLAAIKI